MRIGLNSASRRSAAQPPLTRTCWAIREEALPVFYFGNNFFIGELKGTYRWLKAIGSSGRDEVVEIYSECGSWERRMDRMIELMQADDSFLFALECVKLEEDALAGGEECYVFEVNRIELDT